MRKKITLSLVLAGLFLALDMVFTRLFSFYAPTMNPFLVRLGPSFLAGALCGWLLGPWWAAGTGAASDILGFFMFPSGFSFFPGYTLSAALSGFLYGMILHRKKPVLWRAAAAIGSVTAVVSMGLSSLWRAMMTETSIWILFVDALPWRILAAAVYSVLLFLVQKALLRPAEDVLMKRL